MLKRYGVLSNWVFGLYSSGLRFAVSCLAGSAAFGSSALAAGLFLPANATVCAASNRTSECSDTCERLPFILTSEPVLAAAAAETSISETAIVTLNMFISPTTKFAEVSAQSRLQRKRNSRKNSDFPHTLALIRQGAPSILNIDIAE